MQAALNYLWDMITQSAFEELIQTLGRQGIRLVAVSKTHPPEKIRALYQMGQRAFGENRVQELVRKAEVLPADVEWHFIGHLQSNKLKYIAPFVHTIHSVDRLGLLSDIQSEARKRGRRVRCLLQFHIAAEETKYGMTLPEAVDMLERYPPDAFPDVAFGGVMGMATFTEDMEQVRAEFRALKSIFDSLKTRFYADDPTFCDVSMGMSSDWPIAAAEGSTMVRIGSMLFGERTNG
jgi:pyridoxal phosphate enzyme (YggS family)